MAFRVELGKRAEADLREIFGYIDAESSEAAAKWFRKLENVILSLSELPERGMLTDFDENLRCLRFGTKPHVYLIFYRVDKRKHTVGIRHIRHGAREPLKKLQ